MKLDTSIQINTYDDKIGECEVRVLSRGKFVIEQNLAGQIETTMNGSLSTVCTCKQGEAFDKVTEIIVSHLNRATE